MIEFVRANLLSKLKPNIYNGFPAKEDDKTEYSYGFQKCSDVLD